MYTLFSVEASAPTDQDDDLFGDEGVKGGSGEEGEGGGEIGEGEREEGEGREETEKTEEKEDDEGVRGDGEGVREGGEESDGALFPVDPLTA